MKLTMREVAIMAGVMTIMIRVGGYIFPNTCDLNHISLEEIEQHKQIVAEQQRSIEGYVQELANTDKYIEQIKSDLVVANSAIREYEIQLSELSEQMEELTSSDSQDEYRMVNVVVTYYTALPSENGGNAGMNAIDGRLQVGSLSAPKDIPFGTVFIIDGLAADAQTNTFTVDDRGGAIKWIDSNTMKLDVYIARKQGESDSAYYKRVNNLGVARVAAKYKLPK